MQQDIVLNRMLKLPVAGFYNVHVLARNGQIKLSIQLIAPEEKKMTNVEYVKLWNESAKNHLNVPMLPIPEKEYELG